MFRALRNLIAAYKANHEGMPPTALVLNPEAWGELMRDHEFMMSLDPWDGRDDRDRLTIMDVKLRLMPRTPFKVRVID